MLPETDGRLRSNARVVYRAAAAGLRPDPRMRVSQWAHEFRIVPELGALPGKWRNEVAPYLIEPMDRLSPEDPCERIMITKCSQSGGSAIGENWLGYIMHMAPGPAMYVGPTVLAATDWKEEKLWPTIVATPELSPEKKGTVAPQKSRSGEGSTSKRIRFKGGYCLLAGANSAASLRQHSIRYMVRDDVAGWTDNAEGEGDPRKLSEARLKTYRMFGMAKAVDISSPLDKGDRWSREYATTDLRRYYMACVSCGAITDFDWGDVLQAEKPPFKCHVRCPACGHEHYEPDKSEMRSPDRGACWIPTAPDEDGVVPPKTIKSEDIERWRLRYTGRYVHGYHITGVINAFERWDLIAEAVIAAGDDPELLKPVHNTVFGWEWEQKGTGPEWETIAARKEAGWTRGQIPNGVLFITLSVDVQADGLYWERVGWGPGKQSWLIDYGYLAGSTDAPLEGAWIKLDAVVDRGAAFRGIRLADDLIGVDSGYNADAVYSWVKRRHNALALKGEDGWSKPPIFRARAAEVKKKGKDKGKAKRFGLKVWLVGTWSIKAALMVYLGRGIRKDGAFPTGFHHFPADADETYFQHLVSEYVETVDGKDGPVRQWARRGPNHWLDCRVQNWALSHYAGLWSWDDKRWERRAAEIAEMSKSSTPELFEPAAIMMPSVAPVAEDEAAAEEAPAVPAVTVSSSSSMRRGRRVRATGF